MNATRRPRAAHRSAFASGALALALSVALGGAAFAPVAAHAAPASSSVDIPYETFTLPNGLRVIVHTDRKAPIVVWWYGCDAGYIVFCSTSQTWP